MMPSHAPLSLRSAARFITRARHHFRGASVVAALVALGHGATELPPSAEHIVQSLSLALCAGLLWACSRAALASEAVPDAARQPARHEVEPGERAPFSTPTATPSPRAESESPAQAPARQAETPPHAAPPPASGRPAEDAPRHADQVTGGAPSARPRRPGAFRFGPETDRLLTLLAGEATASTNAPTRIQDAGSASGRTLRGVAPIKLDAAAPRTEAEGALVRIVPAVVRSELALVSAHSEPRPLVVVLDDVAPEPVPKAPTGTAAAAAWTELDALAKRLLALAPDESLVVGVSSIPSARGLGGQAACALARLLAERQAKEVLLIETDFSSPVLEPLVGLHMPPLTGFSQQIFRRVTDGADAPWTVVRAAQKLSVLLEGRIRTPGMAQTVQFVDAFSVLRRRYPVIIAHGPAVGSSVEVRALAAVVDHMVLATPAGAPLADARELASRCLGPTRSWELLSTPEAWPRE